MHIGPFAAAGRFLRGNLHTHSTRSDGLLSPADVCAVYRDAGYDFLSLTDHFMEVYGYPITDIREFQTDGFVTIPGAELHTGTTELGHIWHILAVGLPFDFEPNKPGETGPEIAARAVAAGAFVACAHPAWYGLTEGDVTSLGDIHAIEIYNATSADHNDKPDSVYMLDLLSMRGKCYSACATDDAHFKQERHDAIRGWVQVKAEANEPQAIVDALRAGNYYSSTGPEIYDISLGGPQDATLTVKCSPAERIFLTGFGAKALSTPGHGVTEASFDVSQFRNSPFLRVTVRDAKGGRAWSNPIWLNETTGKYA